MTAKHLFMLHDALIDITRSLDMAKMPCSISDGPTDPEQVPLEGEPLREYEVLCDDGEVHYLFAYSAQHAYNQALDQLMKPVDPAKVWEV